MSLSIENLSVAVTGLEEFGPEIQEAAFRGVVDAMKIAWDESVKVISSTDHGEAYFKKNHPYSRGDGFQIDDPDETVHRQGGAYLRGLKAISPRSGSYGSVLEGVILNEDPKDRWIQDGTERMRARPWMEWIVQRFGPAMSDALQSAIEAAVGRRAA